MENSQGNPEIGMTEDSFETAENSKAGSEAFFDALDSEVNGQIRDNDTEVTQNQQAPAPSAEAIDDGSNNVQVQSNDRTDWEKRYKDSSKEAVRWREAYKEVEKFVPVLDAMKKDSGLVDHVRDYLVNGGRPAQTVQEKLNLKEDFVFDQHEAMTDPQSDSAKVMEAHVDGLVQNRVNTILQDEQKRAAQIQHQKQKSDEEIAFKQKHNMSDEDFEAFKEKASSHIMTLDDINYIVNKDQAAANVAQNTKQEMLNQMKNVRNMPTSASGANSQGQSKSVDKEVFEQILGLNDNVDNLFG
tara:strand:+ start:217 stop:1113 length:897 start_codon:yes stop_codon:yes gene_type:complete